MSLFTDIDIPQPYVAWVDFAILLNRGTPNVSRISLTRMPDGRPMRLMSFEHELTTEGSATWKLEVFDERWTDIESRLFEPTTFNADGTVNREVEFRYYYVGPGGVEGASSIVYYGNLLKLTPEFQTNGVKLSMEGAHSIIKSNTQQQTEEFQDETFKAYIISDIVKKIIDRHDDWVEGFIEPTKKLPAQNHWFWGEGPPSFRKENMSDQQFITKVLLKKAVNEKGIGGFIWYQEQGKDGKQHCYFCTQNRLPSSSAPATAADIREIRKFKFIQGDPNSEVISFSPEVIADITQYMLGGGNVRVVSNDSVTKRVDNHDVSEDKVEKKYLFNKYTVKQEVKDKSTKGRQITEPAYNRLDAEARAITVFMNEWVRNTKATLEIIGDPSILPQRALEVWLILPPNAPGTSGFNVDGNRLHYSSGIYLTNKVTHRIEGGKWTTSIELIRGTSGKGWKGTGVLVSRSQGKP